MIKTIIFDLDGVIVDTKLIHFSSLNEALKKTKKKYEISYSDHLKLYDGLPTVTKLEELLKKNKIHKNEVDKIKKDKKKCTSKLLGQQVKFNPKIYNIFKTLNKKYNLVIASNAIEETLKICIKNLKIKKFVKSYLSNEDVKNPKPHPEIYQKAILKLYNSPKECIIIEDSFFGREAAEHSGANLVGINSEKELTLNLINKSIKEINFKMKKNSNWKDKKLNILIPMAGQGSRFSQAGYTFPKPLIEINQKTMIQTVIENIAIDANFIFLVREEHEKKYNISNLLNVLSPNCKIITVKELTEGAACTTLLAEKLIDNSCPLILANSDQYVEWNSSKTMYKFMSKKIDAAILTFESMHPKWSYAKTGKNGLVTEVAEKKVISKEATVGIYFWKKGSDYVKYAKQMIKKNLRINNEFYVCPVFNEAIKDKKKVVTEKIDKMWGLGTPEDLKYFLDK